jgi:hypothetical protein
MSNPAPPVFFFTFADPDQQSTVALPALQNEESGIRAALATGEQNGSWEFVSGFHCQRADLFETFRNNRVAIFHFGGHSNQQSLWLPAETPGNQIVNGTLLEEFLSTQLSLQLAFFNSCENQAWAAKVATRVPFVIASVAKLNDTIAGHFASAFYGYLATGSTVDDAFSQAAGDVMGTHESSLGDWVEKYKQQPPQFRTFDEAEDFPTPAQATFPWVALKRSGLSSNGSWRLADVAHDPLIGLPPLVVDNDKLPEKPYVTIKGHTREDAPLFFGRSAEIRTVADWALGTSDPARPISLFYGQSGVGKSSLLNAGLLPRLPADCRYAYRRRNHNLIDDLYSAIAEVIAPEPAAPGAPAPSPAQDPAEREAQARTWLNLPHRSLIILDQVEEAITHAVAAGNSIDSELRAFADHVRQLFSEAPPNSPARLLLSFRKEYLAEIRGYFAEGSTENSPELLDHFWLDRLDHDAIVQVVTGAAYSRLIRDKYKIAFPEGDRVPNLIADDLLKGDSPIATVLQIILNELWDAAQPDANGTRSYTVALYESLASRDNPLQGFYAQQRDEICGPEESKTSAQKENKAVPQVEFPAAGQGLELDLLFGHTSELGTSRRRSLDDLKNDYPKLADLGLDLNTLLTANKDRYLLTEPARDPGGSESASGNHSTALSHDTLAPLIRRDFALSSLPGSRARRLLEGRAREWAGGKKGNVLDRADLKTVMRGLPHMRAVTPDEQRLIHASRTERRRALLRSLLLLLLLPVLAVGSLAIYVTRVQQKEKEAMTDASNYAANSSNQLLAIAEGLESVRIQQSGAFWLRLDFLGAIQKTNQEILSNLRQALQFREVYRVRIDDSVVDLDQCAVTLDEHGRPLVTSRNGATLLGGNPVPAIPVSAVCDPASGIIAQISQDGWNLSLWRAGKTQTLRLPVQGSGPMAIRPGGAMLAYGAGLGNTGAESLVLVDLSTGKLIRQIPHLWTGNRVAFSPSGRYLVQDSGEPGIDVRDKTGLDSIDLSQPTPKIVSLTGNDARGRFVGIVGGQEVVAFGGKAFTPPKTLYEKMNPSMHDLMVYRLSDGKLLGYPTPYYDGTTSWSGYDAVTLSPDGRVLASYSSTSLGQIDLWAVPSTLDPAEQGGMTSVDPEVLRLREGPKGEGSPVHLTSFSIPQGIWNIIGASPDLQFVTTAELEQVPEDLNQSGSNTKQAAYIHVWATHPYAQKDLRQINRPVPLFDLGCKLIGNFIDDMAANPSMVTGTENIDYPALSKACKARVKQQNSMVKAKKADQANTPVTKSQASAAPAQPDANPVNKPGQKAERRAERKAERQAARKAAQPQH